jgi:hypothetical protein
VSQQQPLAASPRPSRTATSSIKAVDAASLAVDGVTLASRSGLGNATQRIEEVRLGPSGGLAGSSAGVLYFDDFVSTRTATIGP